MCSIRRVRNRTNSFVSTLRRVLDEKDHKTHSTCSEECILLIWNENMFGEEWRSMDLSFQFDGIPVLVGHLGSEMNVCHWNGALGHRARANKCFSCIQCKHWKLEIEKERDDRFLSSFRLGFRLFFFTFFQSIIAHIVIGVSYRSERHFTLTLHHVELISTTFRSQFLLLLSSSSSALLLFLSLLLLLVHSSIEPEQDHDCANVFLPTFSTFEI